MLERLILAATVVALVSACSYLEGEMSEPFRPPPRDPTVADVGEQLYQRDCAWCHGGEGQGTANGPDVVTGENGPALTDLMLRTGRMPLSVPNEAAQHGEPKYDEDQIAAIVDYVTSLDDEPGPDIPATDPESADLALGTELYLEHCAACHSTTGIGGALSSQQAEEAERIGAGGSGLVAPGLDNVTDVEVAEAMLTGPGNMPVFSEDTFNREERDAIVRYVGYLQDPNLRGGASIGRIGPVAEGAVAWLVAIGLLLLTVRWIGTRAGET
ncbi:MAG: c-type cytochrome [Actinomycetota bacterium]